MAKKSVIKRTVDEVPKDSPDAPPAIPTPPPVDQASEELLPPPPGGHRLPVSTLWPKGVVQNPGGAPKGKRITTWLAEFGDQDLTLAQIDAKLARPGLTLNARTALKQLRRASYEEDGLPAAAWAADRVEGGVDRTVHLTHKQEPTMSLEDAAAMVKKIEKESGPAEF